MFSVVVTGVGMVTALGGNRQATWEALLSGTTGVRPLTLFDTTGYRSQVAAQVDLSALELSEIPEQARRHASRASLMALAAAREALNQAELHPLPGACWPVVFGGGAAGLWEAEGFFAHRLTQGPKARGLTEFLEVPQDVVTDRVALAWQLTGERLTITTACSSSSLAVGVAAERIASGHAEVVVAGGADALCRLTFAGFNSLRAVDTEPAKPFDRRRQGLSLGEGAAVLVLEEENHAQRRGARPLARILGYGVTNDAFHMTQPEPTGSAWARTVRAALAAARVAPEDVGYINAHGTATEQNDPAECAAYSQVFGERLAHVPVSSVKGAIGHCLCAAGGIEAAITVLALHHGVLPPTANFQEPDPSCPIDPIPGSARKQQVEVALSSSFAFGGNSAVLVLGKA